MTKFVHTYDWFMWVIWSEHGMSKLVLNVKCLLSLSFITAAEFFNLGAHSRYYNGALTQNRPFLVIFTTFRSDFWFSLKNQNKHWTLNSSFNSLSKWHEPDIRIYLELCEQQSLEKLDCCLRSPCFSDDFRL